MWLTSYRFTHASGWISKPPRSGTINSLRDKIRELMEEYGRILLIWYTEMGAPRNDADVSQMYSDATRSELSRARKRLPIS